MITKEEVVEIFRAQLPEETKIRVVPRSQHVETLRHHDYIREQIDLGIYTEEGLEDDLLSAVSSYVLLGRMDICYDLLVTYAEGVPDDVFLGYLLAVATHEGYHFRAGPTYTLEAHIEQEREANDHVQEAAPHLWELHQKFEALSPVYQRVYERMKSRGLL